MTGCGAALSVLPPIELPPGDYETLQLHNDTGTAVTVFECDDERCQSGYTPRVVRRGHVDQPVEDVYTPGPLGLADPVTHVLLGCLADLPKANHTGDYPENVTVLLSSATACPGSATGTVVTFHKDGP